MLALKERHNVISDAQSSARRDKSPISLASGTHEGEDLADRILNLSDRLLQLETLHSKLEHDVDQMKPLRKLSTHLTSTPKSYNTPSTLYNTQRITPQKSGANNRYQQNLEVSNSSATELLSNVLHKIDRNEEQVALADEIKNIEYKLNTKIETEIDQRCKAILKMQKA